MTNIERLDVAKHACTKVQEALTMYESTPLHLHIVQAMTHIRLANAALQSLERNLAGQPEPRIGP